MRKIACNKNYRMLRLAKQNQPWKIAPSDIHGDGVIAIKKIPKGFMLGLVAQSPPMNKTELGCFLNHEKNGNCKVLKRAGNQYWCATIKEVGEGEELTVDYRFVPSPPFSRKIDGFI
tara:strand:+ start:362 stop:712 length:351 start_codon:yes stop_codon:yes gene_type:complete